MNQTNSHPQIQKAKEFISKLKELAGHSPEKIAFSVKAQDESVMFNPTQPMRLRSSYKLVIALAYAQKVADDSNFASEEVPIAEVDACDPGYYDGGAKEAWKSTLPEGAKYVASADIARGMLQQSCNACTQYMLNAVGVDRVNRILDELRIESTRFSEQYDELRFPLRGTSTDMVTLINHIAELKPSSAKQALDDVVLPFRVCSVGHGDAQGFGKDGSGTMLSTDESFMHDYNFVWHVNHDGNPISVAFFSNDIDSDTREYLAERFASFACEISCNPELRAELQNISSQQLDRRQWTDTLGARTGRHL